MGVFDKLKSALGFEDEYEDEYEEDLYSDNYISNSNKSEEKYDYSDNNYDSNYKKSNIVSIKDSHQTDSVKILIHEPINYDDAPAILDDIINRNVVVLNLEMLEIDIKRKTFDFVSGGIYAINGKMQKVTKDIFVIAPKNLEIDGKIKDQIASKGFYQL